MRYLRHSAAASLAIVMTAGCCFPIMLELAEQFLRDKQISQHAD